MAWRACKAQLDSQAWHFTLFLFLAFKNTHFHSPIPSWQVLQRKQKAGWFQSQQEFSPRLMYIFSQDTHTQTHSYLSFHVCMWFIKLNPKEFGDPKAPASKILTSPYYSLKFLYGLRSASHDQLILLGKIRSLWIFANLFITLNTCCMSLCIFRLGDLNICVGVGSKWMCLALTLYCKTSLGVNLFPWTIK